MRRILATASVFLLLCCCDRIDRNYFPTDDNPEHVDWTSALACVFDDSVIPEIHLSVTVDEWNRLLTEYDRNSGTKEYISCDVRHIKGEENIRIPNAGLRLRGNTSRRRPEGRSGQKHQSVNPDWHHCHFCLNYHYYEKNPFHTLHGVRRVDLKWFKDDPAYVREMYCYDLFRRFGVWTAVNDVYCRLWLKVGDGNEAYFGVYEMMEHIDRSYLLARRKQFGSADGNLWKCSHGADLRKTNADFGTDENGKEHVYELKEGPEGFEAAEEQLVNFITKLNTLSGEELYTWLESVMDIDLFLRTYAVNVAVGMWDDYWNNSNNYYLYLTPGGKVYFIPFDYDNTIGTSHVCGVQKDSGRQSPLQWGQNNNPLVLKVLQNPDWKAKYLSYLKELCVDENGLNTEQAAALRIRKWQGAIELYVPNDTGEDMVMEDRPADWGNHKEYRLLSNDGNNFFRVKALSVSAMWP